MIILAFFYFFLNQILTDNKKSYLKAMLKQYYDQIFLNCFAKNFSKNRTDYFCLRFFYEKFVKMQRYLPKLGKKDGNPTT